MKTIKAGKDKELREPWRAKIQLLHLYCLWPPLSAAVQAASEKSRRPQGTRRTEKGKVRRINLIKTNEN